MLKIRVIRDVASRVAYHKGGRALNDREKTGRWLGSAAPAAGFTSADIPAEDLAAALSGYTAAGTYMGLRRSSRRRAGWDIVLSPHKSISVAALCLSRAVREAVRQAWEDAVTVTVTAMESLACTSNGKAGTVSTGNLLVAAFTHERSRRDDPHLHTHCIAMNGTRIGQGWRSLEPAPLFRHNLLLDAVLQRELARNLRAAGFSVVLDAKGRATLPGFPNALLLSMSQAKQALDTADAARDYGALAALTNADARRNLLNDRLRPVKRPPTRALPDLIDPPTRRTISQRIRPTHAPARIGPTPPPEVLAASLVTPIYRRSSLWPSTKRLFRSLLEASRIESDAPFTDFLRAIPFVRPPRPLPAVGSIADTYAAARVRHFADRVATKRRAHVRRLLVAQTRQAAAALLDQAKRQYARSRSLLHQQTARHLPTLAAASRRILAATARARTVFAILHERQAAASRSRAAAAHRAAAIATAARRARTAPPPAPQQSLAR